VPVTAPVTLQDYWHLFDVVRSDLDAAYHEFNRFRQRGQDELPEEIRKDAREGARSGD